MNDKLTDEQKNAILKALDETIATGPWDESNFLRAIGKNLREIRENFINQLSIVSKTIQKADSTQTRQLQSDQQEVFISLYSSEGNTIAAWERMLANLPRYMITRAIYATEEAVKHLIKSKDNKMNEAYVAVYINQTDILSIPADKVQVDKLGKPLMNLKDRSLNLDNINRFVHVSGEYHYVKGRLIKNSAEDTD